MMVEDNYKNLAMRLNNGFEIPQIGVGTWTLRGETARQNVCLALEAGFRHIDTAQGYENESEVGQGIADSGVPRNEIFVTTKVNTGIMREGRSAVRQSIDESLNKLKTGYIDLLLIHWPVKDCVKDTWQVMEDYVRQGKVRSIGVSNFNPHHLDDLLTYAEIRPVINQIEVHPLMTQEENIAYNHELGIQVEAWGPFGQGDIDVVGHPVLQSLARKYHKTASQIVLRWIVQRNLITIPRAKPNHFAENQEIMAFSLSDEDMQTISDLNQNLRSNVLNDPESFPW
jgi:2,5-diketo-D-gluconate reductase A